MQQIQFKIDKNDFKKKQGNSVKSNESFFKLSCFELKIKQQIKVEQFQTFSFIITRDLQ